MQRLPIATQTLYAELLEQLTVFDAQRSIAQVPGTFVEKTIRGHCYLYFQYSIPGGKKQVFVGRKDPLLESVVRDFRESRQFFDEDRSQQQRLCAQLSAGGLVHVDASVGRVLEHLASSGLFRLGALLVGTHAFNVLGALLGVGWRTGQQTENTDIAADLQITVSGDQLDLPGALDRLKMGFLPVPALDPKQPATSYKVRGQRLRVDLLCPARSRSDGSPVEIKALNAAAQPLPYLDYLLQHPVRAAVVYGSGVLVNVPDPARFALHKLIVAAERSAAWQTKVEKDLQQAAEILDALLDDRPGDLLLAWDEVVRRNWKKPVLAGLATLGRRQAGTATRLGKLLKL